MADPLLDKAIEKVSKKHNADIILYTGDINNVGADKVIDITAKPKHPNVILILCTRGGCPNSAFRIARRLQEKYQEFTLYVHGQCKSAGTLIAIGSDKIIMSDCAEFGPLDMQLQDKDEIARSISGLNIDEALLNLKEETRKFFRSMLMELTTGAGLSTKTAAELALNLSTSFYSPIVSQIDPMRIGEIRRAVKIALSYGERLISDKKGNLKSPKELAKLVESYPDHGFVIDFKEAETIFKRVEKEGSDESAMGTSLSALIKYPRKDVRIIEVIHPEEHENGASNNKPANTGRTGKSKGRKRKPNKGNTGKILSINKPNREAA